MTALAPRTSWSDRYQAVRAHTAALTAPLSPEDQALQAMADTSPSKWHQAHTSWFFETLLLQPMLPGYRPFDPRFAYLFNSYYESLGPRHPRPQRGLLSRPHLAEVLAYRAHVDAAMLRLIERADADTWARVEGLLALGLNHEQQHQELIVTDIVHAFWHNPLLPTYDPGWAEPDVALTPRWRAHPGGLVEIGQSIQAPLAVAGFSFDNEGPRHRVFLQPFEMADRLVTCGEFLAFVEDGGYARPEFWLSDGWPLAQSWGQPLYWLAPGDARARSTDWQVFGPRGVQPLNPSAPVQNLSVYEAAAYAEWAGARLPTEAEWEAAAGLEGMDGLFDQAWQWTRSAYHPYPGFKPLAGAAAEYNGKFMVGQLVLRGGSTATPAGHTRASYRNFFPPATRWQFSGLRLARDGDKT